MSTVAPLSRRSGGGVVDGCRHRLLTELEIAALNAAGIRTVEREIDGVTYWLPDAHDVQQFLTELTDAGETFSQRTERLAKNRREFTPTQIEDMARQGCSTSMLFPGQGMIEGLLDRIDELKATIADLESKLEPREAYA